MVFRLLYFYKFNVVVINVGINDICGSIVINIVYICMRDFIIDFWDNISFDIVVVLFILFVGNY